ncbi:MAG: hypothetical protein IJA07_06235 [Agathobacter sp.]|nr:hypothetical protein [Agathobacter sp.]MBQ3559088.1 hypothetical protein [Agathobacter sp.]
MVIPTLRKTLLDGNLKASKENAIGIYRGFPIIIAHDNNEDEFTITFNTTSDYDEDNQALTQHLQQERLKNSDILLVTTTPYSVSITIKPPLWANQKTETINRTIDTFIDALITANYYGCCRYCGKKYDGNMTCLELDARDFILCDECVPDYLAAVDKRKAEVLSEKSNYWKGMLGALGGGIIGCLFYFVMYEQGIIKGAVGFLIGKLCMKGYEKFGKTFDLRGAISCIVLMFLLVALSNHICWIMSDMTGDYWLDLGSVLLMTLLSSYQGIAQVIKNTSLHFKINKIKL